jgi:lysophospholipase L1-like esterase/pimeloyl-ACP methyl ester carboxylesterase
MNTRSLSLLFAMFCFAVIAIAQSEPIRIACVGNSITYGSQISNRARDSYPSVLGQLLGDEYEVKNFGFSGRTALLQGDNPYMEHPIYKDVLAYNPQVIVVKLGTNDSKPKNWKHKKSFTRDLRKMITSFHRLSSSPKIYLCYPAKAYNQSYGYINDSIITNDIIPLIDQVADQMNIPIIDLHAATSNMPRLFPDRIHPNAAGAAVLAKTIGASILGRDVEHTPQAFPGKMSVWNGYDRYDFKYNDRSTTVVTPKKIAPGAPWIWRPAFFGAFPSVDIALLAKGFHVVYYDLTHLYGSPRSTQLGTKFYDHLTSMYELSPKVTLEGFSRGGMFALNWAAKNTDKVACIYLDAPVCNAFSWPGRSRNKLWDELLKEWRLTDADMNHFQGNPIDQLAPIAAAKIPIFSVCGGSDTVVPFDENMKTVRSRYLALGGPIEVIVKAGVGHHPHSLENPEPVVDFIVRNQPAFKEYQNYAVRGSLQNSLTRFEQTRKGRVAFLGGSITEMKGWHSMIMQQLKQRFPFTEFEFIEAGIGSTGSTPGAFRLATDVLDKGEIDLLFTEAAVNDNTNYFTPEEQVRGMEGIVRHARIANPNVDIVMLHFIYDPFIEMFKAGRAPDVIFNHDRVANHYQVPSINLVSEVNDRMQAGEFTWKEFGGTHPHWMGHKYYASAIASLFDTMWNLPKDKQKVEAHILPVAPLDKFSYYNGDFLSIESAKLKKGFHIVENWKPSIKAGTRHGFVNVPILEATRPGSKLELTFEGTAIGYFGGCGPDAGIVEYSIDGAPFKQKDTFTDWSSGLYIPWVYMFETELPAGKHKLVLRISKDKNKRSKGTAIHIRNFVVN